MPGERLIGALALFDEDLNKGAGFGWRFPRQGALTGGELDDHVADPLGLANLEHHVLREVVALVEQTQRGDAILDRGAIFAFDHRRARALVCEGLGNFGSNRFGGFVTAAIAGRQRQQWQGQSQQMRRPHGAQASGDQAS